MIRIRLPFQALRHRFLWRQRAPIGPGEIRRIERWLATARVFLAISALVAIRMDPGEIGYSFWAYGLLAFYIAQGVIVILLLRRREQSTYAFRRLVHVADIVWPALISIFATGQANPFFLFFVFVLAAAAYRWGLGETLATAASAVGLLWLESLAFSLGFFDWVDAQLAHLRLPLLHVQSADFEPKRLFMLSIYLLVMGLLLGYLAEQQKQLRSEKAVIARILGKVRVEAGLSGTLQDIVGELLVMYGAGRALIASQEANGNRVYVGEMLLRNGEPSFFRWLEPVPSDREMYLFKSPVEMSFARRNRHREGRGLLLLGLDHNGLEVRDASPEPLEHLASQHNFEQLMTVSFIFGQEWRGRIFFLDPSLNGRDDGRAALPSGVGTPDRSGGIQRLSVATLAAAGWSPGARPLCPRTARWRGAVADCGGNASGCAAAPIFNPGRDRTRGTGPDSGIAARRGSQAAGTDAADEVARYRLQKANRISGGYGGKISARNRYYGAVFLRSGRARHASTSLPRVDPHCSGRPGQRAQAQPRTCCPGTTECGQWPVDPGDRRRRPRFPLQRPPFAGGTGCDGTWTTWSSRNGFVLLRANSR